MKYYYASLLLVAIVAVNADEWYQPPLHTGSCECTGLYSEAGWSLTRCFLLSRLQTIRPGGLDRQKGHCMEHVAQVWYFNFNFSSRHRMKSNLTKQWCPDLLHCKVADDAVLKSAVYANGSHHDMPNCQHVECSCPFGTVFTFSVLQCDSVNARRAPNMARMWPSRDAATQPLSFQTVRKPKRANKQAMFVSTWHV